MGVLTRRHALFFLLADLAVLAVLQRRHGLRKTDRAGVLLQKVMLIGLIIYGKEESACLCIQEPSK